MKSKKGAITLYILIVALLVATGYIILYTNADTKEIEFIGSNQQKILLSKELVNQLQSSIEMASNLATKQTLQDLKKSQGYELQTNLNEHQCKRAKYPILNDGENKQEINCMPNIENASQMFYTINFDKLINQEPEILLDSSSIRINAKKTDNDIIFELITAEAIQTNIYQDFTNYQDEKIKNLIGTGIPRYSNDGKILVPIQNIPNIICDETQTTFGKICAANPELIKQLEKLSQEVLVPQNIQLVITQAYRTFAIQKKLWDCSQICTPSCKGSCNVACNPDGGSLCPHMQAGAIDLNLFQNGLNLNQRTPQRVENIMCDYGFIRWQGEDWHFEYGTNMWQHVQNLRDETGERICIY